MRRQLRIVVPTPANQISVHGPPHIPLASVLQIMFLVYTSKPQDTVIASHVLAVNCSCVYQSRITVRQPVRPGLTSKKRLKNTPV